MIKNCLPRLLPQLRLLQGSRLARGEAGGDTTGIDAAMADFETCRRLPIQNNLAAIRKALENAGVKFIDAGKGGGPG